MALLVRSQSSRRAVSKELTRFLVRAIIWLLQLATTNKLVLTNKMKKPARELLTKVSSKKTPTHLGMKGDRTIMLMDHLRVVAQGRENRLELPVS